MQHPYWNDQEEDDRQGAYLTPHDRDLPYEFQTDEEEMTEHLLYARIVPIFAYGQSKPGGVGHRVANHGIVTCSCGWSSGEKVSLIEAAQIAGRDHPEGRKDHKGY